MDRAVGALCRDNPVSVVSSLGCGGYILINPMQRVSALATAGVLPRRGQRVMENVSGCGGERNLKRHKRRSSLLSKSRSAMPAGRSGVFFEKGGGFFSDVFKRQAMPVIGIENETVGFLGGFEGVA